MADYLFNGEKLPILPDVSQYNTGDYSFSYAMIYRTPYDGKTLLAFFTQPLEKYQRDMGGVEDCIRPTSYPFYTCEYVLRDGAWAVNRTLGNPGYYDNDAPWLTLSDKYGVVIWSNHNIMDTDTGAVWLAASDPVPVLSIDHTAMVQGWIVGKRLAAQRRKA